VKIRKFIPPVKNARESVLLQCFRLLDSHSKKRIFQLTLLQIISGVLDIVGIALIGILGALAVNGVKSTQPGSRIGEVLRLLGLDGQPFQVQVGLLGCLATFLLLLRTFFSITFTRRILFFMSASAARISANLIDKLLSSQLIVVQQKTTQETIYFVTQGVNAIVLGVIATSANLISDMSLLLLLGASTILGGVIVILILIAAPLCGIVKPLIPTRSKSACARRNTSLATPM
jgi:ATP-binding cassette subfamily C protein